MSSRELPDWIAAYLKYTDNTEPPKSYHTWTAISCIAGALQRKVRLLWGHEVLYPNLYVVLVGPSGRCKKGTAMTIGYELLKQCGVAMVSEATTKERLIQRMTEATTSFKDETTSSVKFHCSVTCFSEELSVFLGKNDVEFLSHLTNWYDSRDEWTYETKRSGTDKVQGICFNLLGGTAPDWIPSMFPQEAIGGGFTSRVIFVVEENKAKTVPHHVLTDEERKLKGALIRDLQRIHNMSGEATFTEEARKAYQEWYRTTDEDIRNGSPPIEDPRFGGYVERRATHVKKLAMVVSASHRSDRVVDKEDFERALDYLKKAELRMSKAFGGVGKSLHAEVVETVLNFIAKRKKVKRSTLLRTLRRDVDSQTLKVAEEVLTQMKVISVEHNPKEGEVTYRYVGPEENG